MHGILQARILEWLVISSFRGSSQLRNQIHVSRTGRQVLLPLSHLAKRLDPFKMDSIVDKTGNTKVKRNRWVGFRLGLQREQDPVPLLRSEKRGKADFVFVSISVGNRHRGVQTYFHHHIIDHYIIPQHGKSRQPKPGRSIMLPSPSCNPPRSYFIFSIMILHLKKMFKS